MPTRQVHAIIATCLLLSPGLVRSQEPADPLAPAFAAKVPVIVLTQGVQVATCSVANPLPAQRSEARPVEKAAVQQASPEIEVAFVLDTTGSMGGLIQAAKEKIGRASCRERV